MDNEEEERGVAWWLMPAMDKPNLKLAFLPCSWSMGKQQMEPWIILFTFGLGLVSVDKIVLTTLVSKFLKISAKVCEVDALHSKVQGAQGLAAI